MCSFVLNSGIILGYNPALSIDFRRKTALWSIFFLFRYISLFFNVLFRLQGYLPFDRALPNRSKHQLMRLFYGWTHLLQQSGRTFQAFILVLLTHWDIWKVYLFILRWWSVALLCVCVLYRSASNLQLHLILLSLSLDVLFHKALLSRVTLRRHGWRHVLSQVL